MIRYTFDMEDFYTIKLSSIKDYNNFANYIYDNHYYRGGLIELYLLNNNSLKFLNDIQFNLKINHFKEVKENHSSFTIMNLFILTDDDLNYHLADKYKFKENFDENIYPKKLMEETKNHNLKYLKYNSILNKTMTRLKSKVTVYNLLLKKFIDEVKSNISCHLPPSCSCCDWDFPRHKVTARKKEKKRLHQYELKHIKNTFNFYSKYKSFI